MSRRLEDEETLRRWALAVETERSIQKRGIAWQFTSRDARRKLERLSPVKEVRIARRPKLIERTWYNRLKHEKHGTMKTLFPTSWCSQEASGTLKTSHMPQEKGRPHRSTSKQAREKPAACSPPAMKGYTMILTTKRLVLREFEEEDWRALRAYQADQRYQRYNAWTLQTEQEARALVQQFLAQQKEEPRMKFQLAIALAPGRQLIGTAGIRMNTREDREADIGYELAPDSWGYGYATEIAEALLTYGFEELRLHRIWAWCLTENTASAHVLEKIGMRQEGRLRESRWLHDRWWDTLLYGILEHEWHAQRSLRSV